MFWGSISEKREFYPWGTKLETRGARPRPPAMPPYFPRPPTLAAGTGFRRAISAGSLFGAQTDFLVWGPAPFLVWGAGFFYF